MNETDSHKINGAGPQLPKKDSSTKPVFTKVEPKPHAIAPDIAPHIALTRPDPLTSGRAPQRPKAAAIVIPEKKRS